MSLLIVEGRIIEADTPESPVLSALEFWNQKKTDSGCLDVDIIGYGKYLVKLYLDKGRIRIGICIVTEVGVLDLKEIISRDVDYAIISSRLIPMESFEIDAIQDIFSDFNLAIDKIMSLGKCYAILARCSEKGIAYDFSDEIILDYKPQLESAGSIELALPLYAYQRSGVMWLSGLYSEGIGGMLCDEMGLGKTAQAFGLISHAMEMGNPNILVVTPSSLTINWQREIAKFVPGLDLYAHIGPARIFDQSRFDSERLVLTSYDILLRDSTLFMKREWDIIICDEAQALKNRESQRHEVIRDLSSSCKYLMTGTPIENKLRDIWSLSEIVRPGVLGTFRMFEALIEDNYYDALRLSKHIAPLILRREVKDVLQDLPSLIEQDEPILPSPKFAEFYESARTGKIEQTAGNSMLALLTRLRQVCCYPRLLDSDYRDSSDAKMIRLLEILSAIRENGEDKVIIFSTFTKSLDLIQGVAKRQLDNPYVEIIDGRSSNERRYQILDEFEALPGFGILCINPQAGGTGLTITAANHVIHFNRQWNPAVEKQATARSFRRGQIKPVFVHKMFYLGTVEETIHERLIMKEGLASTSLSDAVEEGDQKDIRQALSMSPIFN